MRLRAGVGVMVRVGAGVRLRVGVGIGVGVRVGIKGRVGGSGGQSSTTLPIFALLPADYLLGRQLEQGEG